LTKVKRNNTSTKTTPLLGKPLFREKGKNNSFGRRKFDLKGEKIEAHSEGCGHSPLFLL